MKRINSATLIISFLLVVLSCSALSFSAVADNYRCTLDAVNPWEGVTAIAFVVGYLSGMSLFVTCLVTAALLGLYGCGLYLIVHLIRRIFGAS